VKIQAARLTSVCDVYAPVYRQVTLPALFGTLPPEAGAPDRELAYSDAAAAWDYYMAHHNKGRGVVLIGHSQGAGILKRLVQERLAAGRSTWRNPTERNGRRVWYASAAGTDPRVAEVILDRVREAVN